MWVVGFTADADTYCCGCAELRYGPDSEDRIDREGNVVHPIFTTDEGDHYCGDCGEWCID